MRKTFSINAQYWDRAFKEASLVLSWEQVDLTSLVLAWKQVDLIRDRLVAEEYFTHELLNSVVKDVCGKWLKEDVLNALHASITENCMLGQVGQGIPFSKSRLAEIFADKHFYVQTKGLDAIYAKLEDSYYPEMSPFRLKDIIEEEAGQYVTEEQAKQVLDALKPHTVMISDAEIDTIGALWATLREISEKDGQKRALRYLWKRVEESY